LRSYKRIVLTDPVGLRSKLEQELGLEGAFDVQMELRLRQIVYECV